MKKILSLLLILSLVLGMGVLVFAESETPAFFDDVYLFEYEPIKPHHLPPGSFVTTLRDCGFTGCNNRQMILYSVTNAHHRVICRNANCPGGHVWQGHPHNAFGNNVCTVCRFSGIGMRYYEEY